MVMWDLTCTCCAGPYGCKGRNILEKCFSQLVGLIYEVFEREWTLCKIYGQYGQQQCQTFSDKISLNPVVRNRDNQEIIKEWSCPLWHDLNADYWSEYVLKRLILFNFRTLTIVKKWVKAFVSRPLTTSKTCTRNFEQGRRTKLHNYHISFNLEKREHVCYVLNPWQTEILHRT